MMSKKSLPEQCRGTVLVTDADRSSAIAIIRSLGRKGWRVIAADSDSRSLGFRSRYAHDQLLYPSPCQAPDELVETLYRAVHEKKIDLLIPVTEEIIQPVTNSRSRFDGMCHLAMADSAALEVVMDKSRTLELAQKLGVPVPPSRIVQSHAQAKDVVETLGWPVVLKPVLSRHYCRERGIIEKHTVSYANSLEELEERMRPFEEKHQILLQKYCPGIGQGVELLAHRGHPLSAFQHKRLAEIPVTGGASAWRESVPLSHELYQYCEQMVKALKWTGLIMFEFKIGEQAQLMEINGRVWGSLPLAVQSGMDFPSQLAEMYLGQPSKTAKEPVSDYRVGVRDFNLELTLKWILRVLSGVGLHLQL